MATSGTTTFNLTTSEIIQEALELLGVVSADDSVQSNDYSSCLKSLNMMVKSWQQKGVFVTHENEATIFLTPGQAKYRLGGTSPDRTALTETLVETTTTADEIAAATTIEITSSTGMVIADAIGIALDDGTMHWTTVATIPDSTSVTITTGLASASAAGSAVFTYRTAMGRPLEISDIRFRNYGGTDSSNSRYLSDLTITEVNKYSYQSIYNKGSLGTPVCYYQNKQNTYTDVSIYPTGNSVTERLKISYKRIIEDFTNPTDVADLPTQWSACLAYNLAAYIAPKYGKEQKAALAIAPIATSLLGEAMSDLQQKTSFKITPRI